MKRSRLQPSTILNRALVVALAVTTATTLRSQPQITSAQLASLTPLELTNCLSQGNYYYLHGPAPDQPYPPLPSAPLDLPGETPVYDLGGGCFLIDDSDVDWNALWQQREIDGTSEQSMRANAMSATFGGSLLTPLDLSSYTGLWLEIPPGGVDESNVSVIVHNTFEWQAYTVLTTEDLSAASWAEEQWLYGTNGDSTPIQLARNGRTNLCIWARSGAPSSTLAIVSQPLDQDVLEGDMVTFSVAASGGGTLSYQWDCGGTSIPGATTSSYTINSVQGSDANLYAVTVSDGIMSVSSRTAHLSVEEGTGDPLLMFVQGPRQDYCFRNGVTYCVGPGVELYGTTTLRGNSVLKFDWYNYTNSGLVVKGALVCDTQPYSPAILTSIDDNSQGVALWGSSANPQPAANGVPYLNLDAASSNVISNLRICFADIGVTTPVLPRELDVWDCQFYQCNIAIANQVWGFGARDILHNVLFANCGAAIGASTNSVEIMAEHVTADVTSFWAAPSPPYKVALTNSIILGTLGDSTIAFAQYVALNPSLTNFQSAAQGNYYLAPGSSFHQAGTASISPTLATEFSQKSTYAPVTLAPYMQVSGDMTLSPQVPRYTSGPPDLGYWYDALDFTAGAFTIAGGTVRVLPGTAIAVRNEYVPAFNKFTMVGFWVEQGSAFISHGTPLKPNVFTATKLVQEAPATDFSQYQISQDLSFGVMSFVPDFEPNDVGSPAPTLDFRFCNFYLPPQDYHFWSGISEDGNRITSPDSSVFWALQDCKVCGGRINLGPPDWVTFGEDYVFAPGAVSWNNSLFDQVTVTLDPTYYWDIQVVNSDLSFQAYNNLFRGGQWFFLEPIPASAGNWVLQDNFFDKVNFVQDTNSPLNFSYNGYWPLSSAELAWDYYGYPWYMPNASQLLAGNNGGGGNEQVLASAPPYQRGPLGDYYLPVTTPLYHAGSRSAADAGLFQYSTRVDQSKEGEESSGHMVNIGLHYVATASSASSLPKDTDGDGIPDYVENWHGDGAYINHTDTETDWHSAYTVTGVYDPTNSLYDDVDLSGDGLVGRIKKALGMQPFDTGNPLTLTPAPSPGPNRIAFVVPISFDVLAGIGNFSLRLDGRPVPFLRWDQDTSGGCLLTWDTTYELPGDHCLQVELHLNGQARPGVMGLLNTATVAIDQLPYSHPMVPGSSGWLNATPSDRLAYALIPQEWQITATSWQLFTSAIANPYFRGIWLSGVSISRSYDAAKHGTVAILRTVEQSTDFGVNCLRYLGSLDLPTMASIACSDWNGACWLDYGVVCHMAGLNASLTTLDQTSLQRLFRIAVWDANYFISRGDTILPTAPVCLMYAIYNLPAPSRGSFPDGLTLPDLNGDQSFQLDSGYLPPELGASVSAAATALGLASRP